MIENSCDAHIRPRGEANQHPTGSGPISPPPGVLLHLPLKSAKDDGGGDGFTDPEAATAAKIIAVHGQGDEAGEPKQHCQGIQGEDGEFVGKALKEARGEGEVGEHQQGPDGDEDQEADFRGGIVEEVILEPVGRWAVRKPHQHS